MGFGIYCGCSLQSSLFYLIKKQVVVEILFGGIQKTGVMYNVAKVQNE